LAAEIKAREGAPHILVNNAGANWGAPLDEFPEAGWDKVMETGCSLSANTHTSL
jgi:NAD(P)-dependent dehydrogenase (short-subunit alcohol dehydrogenase family)